MERGKGSKIYDLDGNEYIDYVLSWGPLILGHADERVVTEVKKRQLSLVRALAHQMSWKLSWPSWSLSVYRRLKWCGWSIPVRKQQ